MKPPFITEEKWGQIPEPQREQICRTAASRLRGGIDGETSFNDAYGKIIGEMMADYFQTPWPGCRAKDPVFRKFAAELLLAHYQFNDFQYALRIYNRGGVLYDHIVAPSSECACGFCGEPLNDSASETRPMVHPECVKNFERFMAKLTRIQTLKLYLSFRKQRSTSGSEHSTSIADALDAEMYMSVFMNDLPSEVEAEKKMST